MPVTNLIIVFISYSSHLLTLIFWIDKGTLPHHCTTVCSIDLFINNTITRICPSKHSKAEKLNNEKKPKKKKKEIPDWEVFKSWHCATPQNIWVCIWLCRQFLNSVSVHAIELNQEPKKNSIPLIWLLFIFPEIRLIAAIINK